MVDVLQKKIECGDALGQSALNDLPFIAGNDSRQKIVGENALSSLLTSINGERDSLVKKRQVRRLLAFSQVFGRQFEQRAEERLIMRARNARRSEHFVVGVVVLVVQKRGRKWGRRRQPLESQNPRFGRASLRHFRSLGAAGRRRPIEIVYWSHVARFGENSRDDRAQPTRCA